MIAQPQEPNKTGQGMYLDRVTSFMINFSLYLFTYLFIYLLILINYNCLFLSSFIYLFNI